MAAEERMAAIDVACKAREAEVDCLRVAVDGRILSTKPSLEAGLCGGWLSAAEGQVLKR